MLVPPKRTSERQATASMAGLRYASRDSCDFALESEHIWRDRELLNTCPTKKKWTQAASRAGLRNASRNSCGFAIESKPIWRDQELLIRWEWAGQNVAVPKRFGDLSMPPGSLKFP